MKKRHMTLLTAFAAAAAFASTAQAAVITTPGDGYAGPYRIAFQTNGSQVAPHSKPMADYNTFVTTEAGLIPELAALSTTWTAIGSTTIVDARDNTGTNPGVETGVPIYTTTGLRIADDNADLWDGTIANPIFFGDGTTTVGQGFGGRAYTGTATDGTAHTSGDGRPLSSGPGQNIRMARGGYTDSGWIGAASFNDTDSRGLKMLAISGVINPIPEPSSMSLLALSGLALLRRRRA